MGMGMSFATHHLNVSKRITSQCMITISDIIASCNDTRLPIEPIRGFCFLEPSCAKKDAGWRIKKKKKQLFGKMIYEKLLKRDSKRNSLED